MRREIILLGCDLCGYERAPDQDGQMFHELESGALLCNNCWEKEGEPE